MIKTFIDMLQESIPYAIAAITFFLLIAMWIRSLIKMTIQCIFAKSFYTRVKMINFFGFEFENKDGKLVFLKKGSAPIVQANLVYDFKKFPNVSNEKLNKADSTFTVFSPAVTFVICWILSILLIVFSKNMPSYLFIVMISLGCGLAFQSTVSVFLSLYSVYKIKTSLAGYIRQTVNKIRSGQPYETLGLLPVENLPYNNIMDSEKILYYSLYMGYLDVINADEELVRTAGKLGVLLDGNEFHTPYIGAAYALVYYYSFRNINPELADHYYSVVKEYIEKDTDSNGFRVRAHYELTVHNDRNFAYQLAEKARANINNFSLGSERAYEEECIQKLFMRLSE